jgi:hypothetical protein
MSTRMNTNSMRRGSAWLLAGLLVLFAPAVALAQGVAHLVLYEVVESPPPRPASVDLEGLPGAFVPGPDGSVTRLAQATLTGPVVSANGSLASWFDGQVDAHAQSRVDLASGVGPINGIFAVDLPGGGAVPGKLSGMLNLSLILTKQAPLAFVFDGTWNTLGKSSVGGTFSGVAQVPMDCGLLADLLAGVVPPVASGTFCYLNPVTHSLELLSSQESDQNGIPLVRFLLSLSAK